MSFALARDRLLALLRDGSLLTASGEAFTEGGTATLRVGPFGGAPGMSKLVRVRLAEPVHHEHRLSVPLRWEATGPTGRLFPMLDADIMLVPDENDETVQLSLAGSYRPPLDGLGAMADRMLMHRVATATVASLLGKIAGGITDAARYDQRL